MHRLTRSGLFAAFALILLAVLGLGIYGLASDTPSPVKRVVMMATAPIRNGLTKAAAWTDDMRDYMKGVDDVKAENEALRKELAEMKSEIRRANELEEENGVLRELLGMQMRYEEYDLAMAEITGTETGSWGYSYLLNIGRESGLEAGQCVIVADGIVGWINEVGSGWASMYPITSSELRAGAVVTRTREMGVLEGNYALSESGCMKLSYLPDNPQIMSGDTVETSGGKWPAGLLAGTVKELQLSPDGLSLWAVVEPACKLDELSRVFVIRSFTVDGE